MSDCKISCAIVLRIHGVYLCWLAACLLAVERIFSQILYDRYMYMQVQYDDPLFVEANADRSDCVHIANGALQRQENIKCTRPVFCIFLIIASLACDYIIFVKLTSHLMAKIMHNRSVGSKFQG